MRLEPIAPGDMTPAQESLYRDMKRGIEDHFSAFGAERDDGALLGPWNAWLHEPDIGRPMWDLTLAMTLNAALPERVREIAILTVGAHFRATYEIYAHIVISRRESQTYDRIASIALGEKPTDLDKWESVAYDAAFALSKGGVLPEPIYRGVVESFGQHGANELFYLIGLYAAVSITLNAFNVPLPENSDPSYFPQIPPLGKAR